MFSFRKNEPQYASIEMEDPRKKKADLKLKQYYNDVNEEDIGYDIQAFTDQHRTACQCICHAIIMFITCCKCMPFKLYMKCCNKLCKRLPKLCACFGCIFIIIAVISISIVGIMFSLTGYIDINNDVKENGFICMNTMDISVKPFDRILIKIVSHNENDIKNTFTTNDYIVNDVFYTKNKDFGYIGELNGNITADFHTLCDIKQKYSNNLKRMENKISTGDYNNFWLLKPFPWFIPAKHVIKYETITCCELTNTVYIDITNQDCVSNDINKGNISCP